jgi:PAS domain S-box-containing protein
MGEDVAVAEGFAMACGALMAGIAGLLWRHHAMRPAWGLRWLAAAMALAALTNLLAPMLVTGAWRAGLIDPRPGLAGLLALTLGFGSLAALVVGMRHYVLRAPPRPWRLFLVLWLSAQIVVLAAARMLGLRYGGDLVAAGLFLYGTALSVAAARREPGVGHGLLALSLSVHPLSLLVLLAVGLDMRAARYLAALPYAMVGLVLLSASLVRIRSELVRELQARGEAEASNRDTQAALQRSRAVQQALLQQAPIPMAFTPVADGRVPHSYWNQAWYRSFGYASGSKEGVGGDEFDFYVEPQAGAGYMRRMLEQGRAGPFEVRLRHASGAEMHCVMQGSVIESDNGPFVVSTFIDVTRQRANELRLREFETMVQSADDGIFFLDQGLITAVNVAVERIFGSAAQDLVGRSPLDWSPATQPDGRGSALAARELIAAALRGEPQRFHWRHCRADGQPFTAQVALTHVEGVPGRLVAVLRDVTEDRDRTLALARSEARFKSTIAVSNTGAWEFQAADQRLWCSPEYFTMLGLDPAAYPADGRATLQAGWVELLHPDDVQPCLRRFTNYLQAGSAGLYESQFRMRHADGHWVWIWSRGQTLRNADGSLGDVTVGTHINITEQKLAEVELRKARQMAEVIARAQLQFIVQKDRRKSFDGLLADILALADSEYGLIGEVLRDAEGRPYLKTFAITNIAWNEATRAVYEADAPKGMEFRNPISLFGAVMATGQPVIANDPAHDPRRAGLPEGHPALDAFLGVPVFHGGEMVALVGVSNRPGGYDEGVIDFLRPLTATIGQLVVAHRNQIRQQETELRLETISNNLPNSMVYQIDCGEDGGTRRFSYLSAGVEHLHGLARGDVLRDAKLIYAQIHPEDLKQLAAKEAECLQGLSEFSTEYRGRGPDGEERWFYLCSTPSRNAEHHIIWDGIELDITERKRAEAELALSRAQLMANLDNTPTVAVQWFDRDGRVLYWNPASEALYGVAAADVLGRIPLGALYADELELQGLLDVIRTIEASGKAYGPYEVDITRQDGRIVSVLATTFPIPMGEGRTAFVCMDVDITARRQAERDLQELNQSLESRVEARTRELSQALNDLNRTQQDLIQSEKLAALGALVAGVAHELNTPIGNAVTVASTLVDVEARMRETIGTGLTRAALNGFLDTVRESGAMLSRNLTRAVDLVSSFKQVAVDQNNHQRRGFDLQEMLSEVQIVMAPSLRKAHVALVVELRDNVEMDSFPGALTQLLMILINNAIIHAFEGRRGGTVTLTASAAGPDRARIVVSDDGVGIAPGSLGRIFEPFFTTKLGKGGSGLGLHIAYNVVTGTLGGRISAQSAPGQGTRMVVELPRSAPDSRA